MSDSSVISTITTFDAELFARIQANSSDAFFITAVFLSNVGHGRCIGIILGGLLMLYVLKKRWHSIACLLLTVPGMYLGELVKIIVQRARPDPAVENGFSFPSGHAITAAIAYGMILLLVYPYLRSRGQRVLACTITGTLVCLVSFARVAIGAHYFSDVLVSIVFGALWLALCVKITDHLRQRWPVSSLTRRGLTSASIVECSSKVSAVPLSYNAA